MTAPRELVFAYGSLVSAADGFLAVLRDHRRCWGVAMNNRVDLPRYKYYLDERGNRPGVYVAFLDVKAARGESVNGVCTPVTEQELAALDERERNYRRRDVTALCDVPGAASRVWTYVGSPGGRRRLTSARAAGRAVVDRGYLEGVASAFKGLGAAEYAACAPSLDPDGLPVVALSRRDLGSTTIET